MTTAWKCQSESPPTLWPCGEAQDLLHLPQPGTNATLLLIHDDPALEAGLTTANSAMALLNTPRHEDWRQSPFFYQQLIAQIKLHLQHHEQAPCGAT